MTQIKVRPTMVSKYNAAVSTLCLALLWKFNVTSAKIDKDNGVLNTRISTIEHIYSDKYVELRTVSGQLYSTIYINGNRISVLETKVAAMKPKEDQFKVKK